jgi:hypothetical protein
MIGETLTSIEVEREMREYNRVQADADSGSRAAGAEAPAMDREGGPTHEGKTERRWPENGNRKGQHQHGDIVSDESRTWLQGGGEWEVVLHLQVKFDGFGEQQNQGLHVLDN